MKDKGGNEVVIKPDPTDLKIWEKEVDEYVKYRSLYKENRKKLYSTIWLQCSPAMQVNLKNLQSFDQFNEAQDCLQLLQGIKEISFQFESFGKFEGEALFDTVGAFYCLFSTTQGNNASYLEHFTAAVNVLSHYGISIGNNTMLINFNTKSFCLLLILLMPSTKLP